MNHPQNAHSGNSANGRPGFFSRRDMLCQTGCGFGHLALLGLLGQTGRAVATSPDSRGGKKNLLASKRSHFAPRAKRVIFLLMHGGISQIDTFDPKPVLTAKDGQTFARTEFASADLPIGQSIGLGKELSLLKSPWEFRHYGKSGLEISDLFPHVATCADELCVIRSMTHGFVTHAPAMQMIHTGSGQFKWPSMGAWVVYGLGSENQNLPGFITICPPGLDSGAHNFGSAFLPAAYQGTPFGATTGAGLPDDARRATFTNLYPAEPSSRLQRLELDLAQAENRQHLARAGYNPQLEARIESFELAFRMQADAPEAMDISREPKETLALYGIDEGPTDNFGRMCLLARRFSERGVRFIQASHSYKWDQHGNLKGGHETNAGEVDKPIAGLLKDLKRRGLLEDTLVYFGSEFGRTPAAQGKDGRDHNPYGFTVWLAGGGVKGGTTYGATDDVGFFAVENQATMHDLHATILHQLGIDHEALTYRHAGRDFRLTDVEGEVMHDVIA